MQTPGNNAPEKNISFVHFLNVAMFSINRGKPVPASLIKWEETKISLKSEREKMKNISFTKNDGTFVAYLTTPDGSVVVIHSDSVATFSRGKSQDSGDVILTFKIRSVQDGAIGNIFNESDQLATVVQLRQLFHEENKKGKVIEIATDYPASNINLGVRVVYLHGDSVVSLDEDDLVESETGSIRGKEFIWLPTKREEYTDINQLDALKKAEYWKKAFPKPAKGQKEVENKLPVPKSTEPSPPPVLTPRLKSLPVVERSIEKKFESALELVKKARKQRAAIIEATASEVSWKLSEVNDVMSGEGDAERTRRSVNYAGENRRGRYRIYFKKFFAQCTNENGDEIPIRITNLSESGACFIHTNSTGDPPPCSVNDTVMLNVSDVRFFNREIFGKIVRGKKTVQKDGTNIFFFGFEFSWNTAPPAFVDSIRKTQMFLLAETSVTESS